MSMENIKKLKGIIPPIITPFKKNGEIDEEAYREVIEFLVGHIQGFFPLGTYGSGPRMSLEERKKGAEIIIDQVRGRVPVIIHVGTADTKTTIELACHAEKIGADAVAAVCPYYCPLSQEQLYAHFFSIRQAISLPFFVYNNIKCSGNFISAQLLSRLAEQGLNGIKDSSFDILTFYQFIREVKSPDFIFIIGTEALILPAMQMGARACVSGLAIAFPEIMARLFQSIVQNKIKEAITLQQKVLKVREIMHLTNSVTAIHAMLKMRGVNSGFPRSPILEIEPEIEKKMKRALKEQNMLA